MSEQPDTLQAPHVKRECRSQDFEIRDEIVRYGTINHYCPCGRIISANKETCLACSTAPRKDPNHA